MGIGYESAWKLPPRYNLPTPTLEISPVFPAVWCGDVTYGREDDRAALSNPLRLAVTLNSKPSAVAESRVRSSPQWVGAGVQPVGLEWSSPSD